MVLLRHYYTSDACYLKFSEQLVIVWFSVVYCVIIFEHCTFYSACLLWYIFYEQREIQILVYEAQTVLPCESRWLIKSRPLTLTYKMFVNMIGNGIFKNVKDFQSG